MITSQVENGIKVIPGYLGFSKGIPFTLADKLWKPFQSGIEKFVKNYGEHATIQTPETYRPKLGSC